MTTSLPMIAPVPWVMLPAAVSETLLSAPALMSLTLKPLAVLVNDRSRAWKRFRVRALRLRL